MNSDRMKHKLAEIESEIKAIAGDDIDHSDRWTSCPEKRAKVRSLLDLRREILNEFIKSITKQDGTRFMPNWFLLILLWL